jgi:hypothetical protein
MKSTLRACLPILAFLMSILLATSLVAEPLSLKRAVELAVSH